MNKKAIGTILAAVALLVLVALIAAPGVEAAGAHTHCICGGTLTGDALAAHNANDGSCKSVTWTELTTANFASFLERNGSNNQIKFKAASGYYYLGEDIDVRAALSGSGLVETWTIMAVGRNIQIDLNGHTLTIYSPIQTWSSPIVICDCQGTGKVERASSTNTTSYAVGAANNAHTGNTVSIYGGAIQGLTCGLGGATGGDTVNNGKIRVYGGEILGLGGNPAIELYKALPEGFTLDIYGGTVRSANGAPVTINSPNVSLNIHGGQVTGGSAITAAGGVTVEGAPSVDHIYLASGQKITLGSSGLQTGASIGVSADNPGVIVTGGAESLPYFHYVGEKNWSVVAEGNDLVLDGHTHCVCGGAAAGMPGHERCTSAEWIRLTQDNINSYLNSGKTQFLESGNYFLGSDITLTATLQVRNNMNVAIDLNGFTLKKSSARVFNVYDGTLSITDCKGTGEVVAPGNKAGIFYTRKNSVLNLYGGTLRITAVDNCEGYALAAVAGDAYLTGDTVKGGSVFNMYGGKLDCSAMTNVSASSGGMIIWHDATMNVYGGEIIAGNAGSINGGAVYIGSSSDIGAPKLNVYGGKIVGGTAGKGSAVYVSATGIMNISGGEIVRKAGDTVSDCIYAGGGNLSLSGSPRVENIFIPNNVRIAVSGALDSTARIGISTGAEGTVTFATVAQGVTGCAGCFTASDGKSAIIQVGNELIRCAPHNHCICGGNSEGATAENGHIHNDTVVWQPLTADAFATEKFTASHPTVRANTYSYLKEGNYYLTADYELDKVYYILPGTTVNICLNGNLLYGNCRLFNASGTLNVGDCIGGGRMQDTRTEASVFGALYLHSGGHINLYGGTLSQADVVYGAGDDTSVVRNHGVVVLGGSDQGCNKIAGQLCQISVYGGKIIGTASERGCAISSVYRSCDIKIYGGEIIGGKGNNGAAIYLGGSASNVVDGVEGGQPDKRGGLYIYGGTVSGGEASSNGGNIYLTGQTGLYMSGGVITGGKAAGNGGNVLIGASSVMEMTGGTIEYGKSKEGGNVIVLGTATIENAVLNRGQADNKGGNLLVFETSECTIKHSQILDGYAAKGGNIVMGCGESYYKGRALCVIEDSEILYGLATERGGNIFMYNGAEVTIRNCRVEDGVSIRNGGNIFCGKDTKYGSNELWRDYYEDWNKSNPTQPPKSWDMSTEWAMTWPKLTMDGGNVTGGVAPTYANVTTGMCDLILAGDLKINDKYTILSTRNLRISNIANVDMSGLTSGAELYINGARLNYAEDGKTVTGQYPVTTGIPYSMKPIFQYDNSLAYYITIEEGGALYLRPRDTHFHCICGGMDPTCGHVDVQFTAWDGSNLMSSENLYLEKDLSVSSAVTISGGNRNICLAGHDFQNSKGRLITISGGTVMIQDCTGKGSLGAKGVAGNTGGVVNVTGPYANVTLQNIRLYRTDVGGTRTTPSNGGILYTAGTTTIRSCTFEDGYAEQGATIGTNGGNLTICGDTTLLRGYATKGGSADGVALVKTKADFSGNLVIDSSDVSDFSMDPHSTLYLHDLETDDPLIRINAPSGTVTIDVDQDYTYMLEASASKTKRILKYYPEESVIRIGEPLPVISGDGKEEQYLTPEEAVMASGASNVVQLTADTELNVVCGQDLYINTNGYTLTGTIDLGGYTLYGVDTTTNQYNNDSVTRLAADVVKNGTVAPSHQTGDKKRYVTIPEYGADGSVEAYTFHRFYIGMNTMSLDPSYVSVGYQMVFAGDEDVVAYLTETDALEFKVWAELDGNRCTPVIMTLDQAVLEAGPNFRRLLVKNMMKEGDDARNQAATKATVHAQLIAHLGDEKIESAVYSYTLRQLVEGANAVYGTANDVYTDRNKKAMLDMCTKFSEYMQGWKIDKILAYGG